MRFFPLSFFDINSQPFLKNVHQKRTVVSSTLKGFFLKRSQLLCVRGKDSVETWPVSAASRSQRQRPAHVPRGADQQ